MKAFEEHWKHTEIYSHEKQIANHFWKSALEWVYKKGEESHWINELSNIIEEELKDEI